MVVIFIISFLLLLNSHVNVDFFSFIKLEKYFKAQRLIIKNINLILKHLNPFS